MARVKTNRRALRTATHENHSRKIGMNQVLKPTMCRHHQAISAPHGPPRFGWGAVTFSITQTCPFHALRPPIWNWWLWVGL